MKVNKNDIFRFSIYENADESFEKIHWTYYPLEFDKFITICPDNSYELWSEVIEIILPTLQINKIGIVVVSIKENANCQFCQNINKVKIRNAAYLFEKSLAHFCGVDWSLTLVSNNLKSKVSFLLTAPFENVFDKNRQPIDELNQPEIVAAKIFEELGISQEIFVETLFIGPSYGPKVLELIPNFDLHNYPDIGPDIQVGIRCDLYENWGFVLKALRMGIKPVVTCDSLPPRPISGFLNGVSSINLFVDENTNTKRISEIEENGIPLKLFSDKDETPELKRKFFDFKSIHFIKNWSKENLDKFKILSYDSRLRSKRILVGQEGTFLSVYHWKNNFPVDNQKGNLYLDAIECEDFAKEADLFYYYNQKQL
jgi:hypothetical protein